jgi:hypothetical protein
MKDTLTAQRKGEVIISHKEKQPEKKQTYMSEEERNKYE